MSVVHEHRRVTVHRCGTAASPRRGMTKMIDRKARDNLAIIVDRYLGEEISASEFDEAINLLQRGTEDHTVREIVNWLWFHYDDLVDHKVVATKEQWDWFQRILLVLRADGELVRTKRHRWTVRQPIAASGVIAFVIALRAVGFTDSLLLACLPLGCLSAALWWWRRDERGEWRDLDLIFPFSSVPEMLGVRRRTSGFAKRRYPEHLRDRRIRGRITEFGMWVQFVPLWLFVSPLVLLAQCLPEGASRWGIAVP